MCVDIIGQRLVQVVKMNGEIDQRIRPAGGDFL
jgi:hypothetical protein